jgi:hypothetical protein
MRKQNTRLYWVFALAMSLFLILAACASMTGEPLPEILFWQVGSPYTGETPALSIPAELRDAAKAAGFSIRMAVFPAKDFTEVFKGAMGKNLAPDILMFDNFGILEGAQTSLGTFTGLYTLPGVKESLMLVTESMKYISGWTYLNTYLNKTSKGFEAAKALALRKPTFTPVVIPSDIRDRALAATRALYKNDALTLKQLYQPGFSNESTFSNQPEPDAAFSEPAVVDYWGKPQCAFVSTWVAYEAKRSMGFKYYLLAFGKSDSNWNLLSLSDISFNLIPGLKALSQNPAGGTGLSGFNILNPLEGSISKRFPESEKPDVVWTSAGVNAAFYLVDTQWSFGSTWSTSSFTVVVSSPDKTTYVMKAIGVGMQPHRLRIWAVDREGNYSIGPWRRFNYSN